MLKLCVVAGACAMTNVYAFSPFLKLDLGTGFSTYEIELNTNISSVEGASVNKLVGQPDHMSFSVGFAEQIDQGFFIGFMVGGSKNKGDAKITTTFNCAQPNSATTTYSLPHTYKAGLIFGANMAQNVEIYLIPQYMQARVESVSVGAVRKVNQKGWGAELGILSALTDSLSIGLSVAHNNLGDYVIKDIVNSNTVKVATETHGYTTLSVSTVLSF